MPSEVGQFFLMRLINSNPSKTTDSSVGICEIGGIGAGKIGKRGARGGMGISGISDNINLNIQIDINNESNTTESNRTNIDLYILNLGTGFCNLGVTGAVISGVSFGNLGVIGAVIGSIVQTMLD